MADTRVVLITGAARRIGACIAQTFHAQHFNVLIHYHRSAAAAAALADTLNGQRPDSARLIQGDLCAAAAAESLARQAMAQYSRLDVLVNNASSFYATEFGQSTPQQWDDLVDSNLRTAYFLSQALADEIGRRRGAVINIVDIHADHPLKRHPIYSIAKAGLKAMTKSLAIELAPAVRVNGVSPGAVLWPASLENDDDPEVLQERQEILKSIPLGALGRPSDIADTVCFLAQQADYMTGQVIRVDGGRSLS